MEVYLDDPRFPKIRVDVDIREHIRSYKCASGPNKDKKCSCDGSRGCGSSEDTISCLEHPCIESGLAWLGFTSSTGDSFSVHDVESWSFFNLGQDGGLTSFGKNLAGQLGLGDIRDRNIGNLLVGLDGTVVRDMAAGKAHSIALTTMGDVYTWGANHFGQLGQGDTNERIEPTKVGCIVTLKHCMLYFSYRIIISCTTLIALHVCQAGPSPRVSAYFSIPGRPLRLSEGHSELPKATSCRSLRF